VSGYPATVGHYTVDVVPTKTVTNNYTRPCMFALFDQDGHLICHCPDRLHADLIALRLSAYDVMEHTMRSVADLEIEEDATMVIPRPWITSPPPPLPSLEERLDGEKKPLA
jgi:hypothetical protein